MSDVITLKTTEILDRQNELFVKGNVEELMKDFSEEAVLFTPDGVLEGINSIKNFFILMSLQIYCLLARALN